MSAVRTYEIVQQVKTVIRDVSPEGALAVLNRVQKIEIDTDISGSYAIIERSRVVDVTVTEE